MPELPRRNLERKARYRDLAFAATRLNELGARHSETLNQRDTYFHVPKGRLKLRECPSCEAQLIAYERPDEVGVRASRYFLVAVPDGPLLKAALAATLCIRTVVEKTRTVYLWHNVRIHLDEIKGSGVFIEFEAVMGPGDSDAVAEERLAQLANLLEIKEADWLAVGYGDLATDLE